MLARCLISRALERFSFVRKVLKEMGKFNLIFCSVISGKYEWEQGPMMTRKLPFLSLCPDLSMK